MIPGLNKRVFNFYDLMLYVALVRKHLRLMVLLVCMALLGGLAAYIYSRPVYWSKSVVQYSSLSLPMDSDSVYHDGNFNNVVGVMKGDEVMRRTAARLGVVADAAEIRAKYIRDIRIGLNTAGKMEVQVWSYERTWPARWPQIMVDEFMKIRSEQREHYRDTIVSAYGDEIHHLVQRMDNEDADKTAFDHRNKSTETYVDVSRLGNVPALMAQTKAHIEQLDTLRKRLDDPSLDTVARLSIITAANA